MVSEREKSGVLSCTFNKQTGCFDVQVLNPLHLIHMIIDGYGMFDPSATEVGLDDPDNTAALLSHFHWLESYFEVFGDGIPKISYRDIEHRTNVDYAFVLENLKNNLQDMSDSDMEEARKNADEIGADADQIKARILAL
jgi:hypothetical protein